MIGKIMSRFKNLIEQEVERYNDEVIEIILRSENVEEAIEEVHTTLRHPMDLEYEYIEEEIREYYAEQHEGDE